MTRAGRVELTRVTGERSAAARRDRSTAHPRTPTSTRAAAVLELQRASGNRAVARHLAVQRDVAPPKGVTTAGKELGEVQGWAQDEQRSQKVLTTAAVVDLDLSQKTNVIEAVRALQASLPALRAATSPFAPGLAALRVALDKANATRQALKNATDDVDRLKAKDILLEGQAAMAKAATALNGVKGVNAQIKKNLKVLHGNMASTGGIVDIVNGISQTIQDVEALDTEQGIKPEAVERVLFLLRSFLAVNDPASTDAPKAAEVAAMKGQMGQMQADFAAVFGSSAQLGLFIDYADRLVRQIDVRESMAKAGAPIKQVPGEADAKAYFTKLKKASNDDLFKAYTAFMEAFFFHKVVANIRDLTAANNALLSVPASITGIRPLVCTGYATLGAEFMALAGATKGEIVLGIRAGDAQLLTEGGIDAGHALAKFSRGGQDRWISNDLVVDSEDGGIGPNAVAWENKNLPLIRAKGATMADAVDAMMGELAKARAAARARKAKAPTKAKKAKKAK